MDAESIIREYIRPRTKAKAEFFAGIALLAAAAASFLMKFSADGDLINAIPYLFLLAGVYLGANAAPDLFGALFAMRRSLRILKENVLTDSAAMELMAGTGAHEKHYLFTEHFVFSEWSGTAVPLSEIKGYNVSKANWSRAAGGAWDGIMAETFSGKWYTIAGPHVKYDEYTAVRRLLDEAIEKNTASAAENG